MKFYVDGACRRNGRPDATGAAAACLMTRGKRYYYKKKRVHVPRFSYEAVTNQRAEITAIIMALEWALEKYEELDTCPYLVVKIHSDSRYAIGCMSEWIYKWRNNGWSNSNGRPVANREIIEEAVCLEDRVEELGSVEYIWVPREENTNADRHCNEALDEDDSCARNLLLL